MDEQRQRDLKRSFKEAEQAAARDKLGLSEQQLAQLLDALDAALEEQDCDHTLRRTETWVKEHNLVLAKVLAGVRAFGGFCDCEVLANVEPHKFGHPE